jgi:cell division protein ZapE
MRLKPYYSNSIQQLDYHEDRQQLQAMDSLEVLFQALTAPPAKPDFLQSVRRVFQGERYPKRNMVMGRYLWGGVGRGKTWSMDLFFNSLPLDAKLRQHYQHFMQMIHGQLTELKGNPDPLKIVANRLAAQYRIICLDEFHVNDITDAMLLHGLLTSLFEQGLVLVATSNLHPDDLYRNGLQRERFIPAIELIKQHMELIEFSGTNDYRQRQLQQADSYYLLSDDEDLQRFRALFYSTAGGKGQERTTLNINRRHIKVRAMTDEVAWFEFYELCGTARSARDYIALANRFHTVFIEGLPVMGDAHDDQARRFVHLVDEFYDRNIRLVLCAEAQPEALYSGRRLNFEFGRTVSRLQEMRSREYQVRSRAAKASALEQGIEKSENSVSETLAGEDDAIGF